MPIVSLGVVGGGLLLDQLANDGGVTKAITGGVGDIASDYKNLGTTNFRANAWQPGYAAGVATPLYGGYEGGAGSMAGHGLAGMANAQAMSSGAYNAMMSGPAAPVQAQYGLASMGDAQYGSAMYGQAAQAQAAQTAATFGDASFQEKLYQAQEDQQLSQLERAARNGDQSASLALLKTAAEGSAPSVAEIQLRRGLNDSLAAQQAQMGAARGQAGLALAGGNAMANSANLMNQNSMNAAMLRAQEMAQARDTYGNLAAQNRAQDLSRLGMSNQLNLQNAQWGNDYGQFNATQGQNASFQNANFANNAANMNAQMATQAALQNAQNSTNMSNWNAQRGTDVSMGNAAAANQMTNANAQRATDASMANASYANQIGVANMNALNSYKTAVGNVGAAYGNMGLGYLNSAQKPWETQMDAQLKTNQLNSDQFYKAQQIGANSWDNTNQINSGIELYNRQTQQNNVKDAYKAGGEAIKFVGGLVAGGKP